MWTYGEMDRHYEANRCFSKFCERERFLQTKSISVNVLYLKLEIVCGFSRPGSLCGSVKIFPNKTQFFTIIVLGENIRPTHSPTLLHYMLYQTGNPEQDDTVSTLEFFPSHF